MRYVKYVGIPIDVRGQVLRLVPSRPLAPHLALKNPVLGGGVCEALPPTLSALLRWNFSVRSESLGCSRAHLPNLSVGYSVWKFSPRSARRREKRAPRRDVSPAGRRAREQPMALSRNEKSKHRRAEGVGGSASHTPPPSTRFVEAD